MKLNKKALRSALCCLSGFAFTGLTTCGLYRVKTIYGNDAALIGFWIIMAILASTLVYLYEDENS